MDTHVIRGRVANLSCSGLLATTRVTAPERLLGTMATLALRLDGTDASWLDLRGQILRIGACSVAMRLEGVPPSFTRILDETLSQSRDHDRVLSVVLVDGTSKRRCEFAEGFRAAGCEVIEVASPLEAIVRLGESHFEPDLIAIADSVPTTISDELRRFVETEHPRAVLIAIGHMFHAAAGFSHWLSAADSSGEIAAQIRDVLTRFPRP